MPTASEWTVLKPAQIAILDSGFANRASPYPEIAAALIGRTLLRSRHLVALIAIAGQPRIETRLHMLFWHLADRFGRVRGDSITIDLPLTHGMLAGLVAARRPSVTTALSALTRSGTLEREDEGWILRGTVPAPYAELRDDSRS